MATRIHPKNVHEKSPKNVHEMSPKKRTSRGRNVTKSVHEMSPLLSTRCHLLCPRDVCHPHGWLPISLLYLLFSPLCVGMLFSKQPYNYSIDQSTYCNRKVCLLRGQLILDYRVSKILGLGRRLKMYLQLIPSRCHPLPPQQHLSNFVF